MSRTQRPQPSARARPYVVRRRSDVFKRNRPRTGRYIDRIKEKSRLGRDAIGRIGLIIELVNATGAREDRVFYFGPAALERFESGKYDSGQHVMVFPGNRVLANGESHLVVDDILLCDSNGILETA